MKQFTLKVLLLTTFLGAHTALPNTPPEKVQQNLKTRITGAIYWGTKKFKQISARDLLNKAAKPFQIKTYRPLFSAQTYLNNPKTSIGIVGTAAAVIALLYYKAPSFSESSAIKWLKDSRLNFCKYFSKAENKPDTENKNNSTGNDTNKAEVIGKKEDKTNSSNNSSNGSDSDNDNDSNGSNGSDKGNGDSCHPNSENKKKEQ